MGYKYEGSNRFVLSVYVMFMLCILAFRSVTFSHTESHLNLIIKTNIVGSGALQKNSQ